MSLRTDSGLLFQSNIDLSRHSTMHVGGPAEYFVEPSTEDELLQALQFARQRNLRYLLLGKGSNIIFSDDGYPGVVISMARFSSDHMVPQLDPPGATVSSGISLYKFCLFCKDHRLGGSEFLCSIPGSVGGALVMNAGFSRFPGQKNQIGDLVEWVAILNSQGEREVWDRSKLSFSYRQSNLKGQIVLEAHLRLWRRSEEEIHHEIQANFDYRAKVQNVRYPSSGSIFKNPSPDMTAGKLIDSLGLKGSRVGDAMISPEHANYMINVGNARGSDFAELINQVRKAVLDATGIQLETEVILL